MTPVLIVDNIMFSLVKKLQKVHSILHFIRLNPNTFNISELVISASRYIPLAWPVLHHCLAGKAHSNPTKLYLETFFDARTCLINSFLITVALS